MLLISEECIHKVCDSGSTSSVFGNPRSSVLIKNKKIHNNNNYKRELSAKQ